MNFATSVLIVSAFVEKSSVADGRIEEEDSDGEKDATVGAFDREMIACVRKTLPAVILMV